MANVPGVFSVELCGGAVISLNSSEGLHSGDSRQAIGSDAIPSRVGAIVSRFVDPPQTNTTKIISTMAVH